MKQKPHAELEFVEHEFVEYDNLEIPSVEFDSNLQDILNSSP